MSSLQIARAYAEALHDLVESKGTVGRAIDDLDTVHHLIGKDEFFRSFFHSPRLDREHKKRILAKALGDRLDRPVMGLLHVLVDRQREGVFDNIVTEFGRHRDARERRIHAKVTSAVPLPEDQKQELVSRLAHATGKTVLLHEKVDPAVLGGLVVKLGDRVIDGTVRRRLQKLRRALLLEEE